MQVVIQVEVTTEIPVIKRGDEIINPGGDFMALSREIQEQTARGFGGKLVWLKVSAVYTPINPNMCMVKGCYNLRCETHGTR
jgi:hypothetical protein